MADSSLSLGGRLCTSFGLKVWYQLENNAAGSLQYLKKQARQAQGSLP